MEDEPHVADVDNFDESVGGQQADEELVQGFELNGEIEGEILENNDATDKLEGQLIEERQSVTNDENITGVSSENTLGQEVETTTFSEEEDYVADTMNIQQKNATIEYQEIIQPRP